MANAEHVAYKGIRDLFEYELYKFTLYLLYLQQSVEIT